MSNDELTLFLIMMFLFPVYLFLLRMDRTRTFIVFFLAILWGFIAQLILGRSFNLYTSNITNYILYVSVAVLMTWGTALTSIWALHSWLTRVLRISPGLGIHALCGLPILILLEWIGSNIIKMKLHDYGEYTAVIPFLNAMHAPKWFYLYYITFAVLFFYFTRFGGMYGKGSVHIFSGSRTVAVHENEKSD